MRTLLFLLLISLGFALRAPDLYRAYEETSRKRPQEVKPYPLEFMNVLYDLYVGGKDRKGGDKESYIYRAWLFENTMAFIGYFHSTFWTSGRFEDYVRQTGQIREAMRGGRLREGDAGAEGILQSRLDDYYRAVLIGVMAGGSYGLVPFPSSEQSGKYGKVLSPVFAFRVGQQQLRHAVLVEYAERVAQRRAELAVLTFYARNLCTGEVYSLTQLDVGRLGGVSIGGECCSAILSSIADMKTAIVNALDVISDQNRAFGDLTCATLLAILHSAKVEQEALEIGLFSLSAQYGMLINQEKAVAK